MMAWGDFSSRLEYVAVGTARIDYSKSIPELSDGVNQDSRKSRGEAFHRKRPQSGGTALREQSSVQPSGSQRVNSSQSEAINGNEPQLKLLSNEEKYSLKKEGHSQKSRRLMI
jgi:hypothetical protein